MIKALTGNTILLGLSELNIKKLQQDQPIKFNLREMGLPNLDVVIFAGKDEDTMTQMFKDHIHPTKTFFDDSRSQPKKEQNIDRAMSIVYWNNARNMSQEEFTAWMTTKN